MSENTSYTVMELAEKVGVPRTTINDWLNKYSTYIEFSMQGKRRVYSETTLTVLNKVSELRNAGKSSFEIEQELAKTCAIQPEPQEEPSAASAAPAAPSAEKPEVQAAASSAAVTVPPAPDYTLAVKEQTDEITRMLGERFQDILGKMDSLEDKAHKNAVRAWYFCAFAFILLILLGAGGYFAWEYQKQQTAESRRKEQALQTLRTQTEALQTQGVSMEEQIKTLQKELPAQREAFDKALTEMRKDADQRRAAEVAAEKDKFAAKQLEHTKELENLRLSSNLKLSEEQKKSAGLSAKLEKAESENKKAAELLEQQKKQLEELKKKSSK